MATFKIDGNEHELKLTYESVKRLNKVFEGGSYALIGSAFQGDLDTFPQVVHAALLHTGEKITQKQVEQAVEDAVENEELAFEDITKIYAEVVTESFFYKPTVAKLMKQNPEMKKAYEQLMA